MHQTWQTRSVLKKTDRYLKHNITTLSSSCPFFHLSKSVHPFFSSYFLICDSMLEQIVCFQFFWPALKGWSVGQVQPDNFFGKTPCTDACISARSFFGKTCTYRHFEPTHLKSSPLFIFSTNSLGQDSLSVHLFSITIESRFTAAKIKLGEDSPSWFVFPRSRFTFK